MSVFRKANVYVQNRLAGSIYETEDGYEFAYNDLYLEEENPLPVSLTLPLDEKIHKSKTLFSFFDGLIPEGWLLNIATEKWNIKRTDRFGLLLVACKDCIGDVSIVEVEDDNK